MNATTKLMTIAAAALTLMAVTSTSAFAQGPRRANTTTTTTKTINTPRGSTTTTRTVRTPAARPVVVKTRTVARAPQRPRRVLVAWQCPARGKTTRTFYQTARPNIRRSHKCTPVYKPVRPNQPFAVRPGYNPHTVTVIRKG